MSYKYYRNGNYRVHLYDDGTKIRFLDDGETEFKPLFPENIDLKISNKCSIGCKYCHENSTCDGKIMKGMDEPFLLDPLSDLSLQINNKNFMKFVEKLKAGTEIAIGGGALSELNEQLFLLLAIFHECGIISNITVNAAELMKDSFYAKLIKYTTRDKSFRTRYGFFLNNNPSLKPYLNALIISKDLSYDYIYGLGISYSKNEKCKKRMLELKKLFPNSIVIHTIYGITDADDYQWLSENGFKVLILGYKNFRRGEEFKAENNDLILRNQEMFRKNLSQYFREFKRISFDCLAVEQLNLKEIVAPEVWEKTYMGDDGKFTMYVDFVEEHFAVNSSSNIRYRLQDFSYDPNLIFKMISTNN